MRVVNLVKTSYSASFFLIVLALSGCAGSAKDKARGKSNDGDGTANAASALTDQKKAVFAFRVDVARLLEGPLGSVVKAAPAGVAFGGPITSTKSIELYASAPASLASFTQMPQTGEMPMEFFARVEFNDAAAAQTATEVLKNASTETEINGKSYYTPKPGERMSGQFFFRYANDTTLEVGSKLYLQRDSRDLVSERLAQEWKKSANKAIHIAVDLAGARGLIDEVVKPLQQNPMAQPVVDLLNKSGYLEISVDLASDELFAISAIPENAADAQQVKAALDRSGTMLKGMALMGMGNLDPKMTKMVGELLDTLKTREEGNRVTLSAVKPAGFEEAMMAGAQAAQAAAVGAQGENRFRQVALGWHNFVSASGQFPYAIRQSDDRYSDQLSWRVLLLPYLEEQALVDTFDVTASWDDAANKWLEDNMPASYGPNAPRTDVCYIVPAKPPQTFGDLIDGRSNTIMLIQNPNPVPWTQPVDLSVAEAIKIVTELSDGEKLVVAFYDGRVARISNQVDEEQLRRLFEPADGQPVDTDF